MTTFLTSEPCDEDSLWKLFRQTAEERLGPQVCSYCDKISSVEHISNDNIDMEAIIYWWYCTKPTPPSLDYTEVPLLGYDAWSTVTFSLVLTSQQINVLYVIPQNDVPGSKVGAVTRRA